MFEKFLVDDSGQGFVEYALVVAMVSVIAMASMKAVGAMVSNTLSTIVQRMN